MIFQIQSKVLIFLSEGDSLMGSGSEDEDEESSLGHHHTNNINVSHLGHGLGSGSLGEQVIGHSSDLPHGSDSCKQEDSEDQG